MSTVFDVGAHLGETAQTFRDEFSDADIYCFEPEPNNYDVLAKKVSKYDNVRTYEIALSDSGGTEELFLADHDSAHSLSNKDRKNSVTVCCNTLDSFCIDNEIDYIDLLKIDTEGHELCVLRGSKKMLSEGRIAYVKLETTFNRGIMYFCHFDELYDVLSDYGFKVFGVYDQSLDWEEDRYLLFSDVVFVHSSAPWPS